MTIKAYGAGPARTMSRSRSPIAASAIPTCTPCALHFSPANPRHGLSAAVLRHGRPFSQPHGAVGPIPPSTDATLTGAGPVVNLG